MNPHYTTPEGLNCVRDCSGKPGRRRTWSGKPDPEPAESVRFRIPFGCSKSDTPRVVEGEGERPKTSSEFKLITDKFHLKLIRLSVTPYSSADPHWNSVV
jgi:hypothetical protein